MALIYVFVTLVVTFLFESIQACYLHDTGLLDVDYSSMMTPINNICIEHTVESHSNTKLAIDNVRVFDGHKLLDLGTVVIDGNVIGNDPTGAQHIDGRGGVLLPGLIDSHCHPASVIHLKDLSRYGVTTGMVMACFIPQLCRSLQNHIGLVDLRLSSVPAAAPKSAHGNITAMIDKTGALLVSNMSMAKPWVDQQVAWGSDYIKLVAESPGLDQPTLDALTEEAHKHNKKVVCHAAVLSAIDQASKARVDQIHHTPLDKQITPSLAKQILYHNQVVVPTLSMMQAITQNRPTANYTAARESVRTLHHATVPMLAGTDANDQTIIAKVPFGSSMHQELALLVEAGLSTVEALQAATLQAAKYWGLKDRGVIAPGMRADLLLIDGDPIADIKATRNIKRVWLAGVEYTEDIGTF